MILLDWLLINEGELKGITEFSSAHEKKIMTNSIAIGIEEMLDDEELVFEVGFTKKYQGFQRGDDNLRLERYRLDLEGLVLSLLEKK